MGKKTVSELNYIDNLAKNKGKIFKVKLIPNSPQTAFIGEMADGTLKIAVSAAPEKNRANQALLVFLAGRWQIDVRFLKIISGSSSRRKLIKIVS